MGLKGLEHSSDETELSLLMRKAQDGDSASYTLLLTKVQVMLKGFVDNSFNRLGLKNFGGQEDVIQEVLLAIHSKRASFDESQFFLPWMYAIARYKVIDYFRKNKKNVYSAVSLSVSLETEDEIMAFDIAVITDFGVQYDVDKLCQMLPTKQREILVMMKIDGLSIQEVEAKTGYKASDIKVNVHRALKFLQEKMQESQ
jgi:RNA polymerase sigma-70 factor (ECF subfamily)